MSKDKKAVAKLSIGYTTCCLDQTELATLARLTNDALAATHEEFELQRSQGIQLDTLNMKIWNALHSLETENHYAKLVANSQIGLTIEDLASADKHHTAYIDTLDVIIDKLEERS